MLITLNGRAFLATAVVGWHTLSNGDIYVQLIGGSIAYFKDITEEERTALLWVLNSFFSQQVNALELYRNRDLLQPPAPPPAPASAAPSGRVAGEGSKLTPQEMEKLEAHLRAPVAPPTPTLPDPYAPPEPDLSAITVRAELAKLLKRQPTDEEVAVAMKKLREFEVVEGGRK